MELEPTMESAPFEVSTYTAGILILDEDLVSQALSLMVFSSYSIRHVFLLIYQQGSKTLVVIINFFAIVLKSTFLSQIHTYL